LYPLVQFAPSPQGTPLLVAYSFILRTRTLGKRAFSFNGPVAISPFGRQPRRTAQSLAAPSPVARGHPARYANARLTSPNRVRLPERYSWRACSSFSALNLPARQCVNHTAPRSFEMQSRIAAPAGNPSPMERSDSRARLILVVGLPGSGKTTLAKALESRL